LTCLRLRLPVELRRRSGRVLAELLEHFIMVQCDGLDDTHHLQQRQIATQLRGLRPPCQLLPRPVLIPKQLGLEFNQTFVRNLAINFKTTL
jgi:hypothetical protein